MAQLYLPTIMRRDAGNRATVVVPGPTVGVVLAQLVADCPAVGPHLLDETGHVRGHINVFVNGDDIRDLQGPDTALAERDEISLIPAMAGGSR
jgi:molybdopterin synthase sulfur carrier subunit